MDLGTQRSPSDDAEGRPGTPPLFLLALATFAVSVVIAIVMIASAACGGNGGKSPASAAGATAPTSTKAAATTATSAASTTATTPPTQATAAATPSSSASATKTAGATTAPDNSALVSCALLAPVDQNHRIPRDCVLGPLVDIGGGMSLNSEAAAAFNQMANAASAAGLNIFAVSAYRSYDLQVTLYNQEVATYGPDQDTVALPGHSEHQLGTTLDVNDISEGFGDTAEGKWLVQNAANYGFVISYPPGKESLTGYAYEPWHIRYVGVSTAKSALSSGTTLNRFLGGG
jgi:D-alanyl-D-alanine carboxypeptidase